MRDEYIYLQLIVGTACWGGVFVFGELAVRGLPPMYVAFVRYLIASVALVVLIVATRQLVIVWGRDLGWLAALGLTGVWAYNTLFFLGLKYSTASHGAIIIATSPAWTIALLALLRLESLSLRRFVGLVIALLGVAMVAAPATDTWSSRRLLGDLLYVAGAIVWAVYSVLGKRVLKRFSPSVATTYATLIGTLLLLPLALISGGASEVAQTTASDWLALFYMALFGTVVAFVLWYRGIAKLGAARTSIFLNLVPVWGVSLSVLILHEQLTGLQLLGMVTVLAGVMLVQTRTRPAPAPARSSIG